MFLSRKGVYTIFICGVYFNIRAKRFFLSIYLQIQMEKIGDFDKDAIFTIIKKCDCFVIEF